MPVPTITTQLTASGIDQTIIKLTGIFSPGMNSVDIYRATSRNGVYSKIEDDYSSFDVDVSYMDTGLSAGTNYYYKIKATNDSGETPTFSNIAEGRTWETWQSTGKLRAAYNAIRDRIEADTNFRNFYAMIEYDCEAKEKAYPYFRLDFIGLTSEPSQAQLNEELILELPFAIAIESDDKERISENLLKAIEIFINAYQGTSDEPTFSNRVLKTSISIDDVDIQEAQTEEDNHLGIAAGLLSITAQHYEQGTL